MSDYQIGSGILPADTDLIVESFAQSSPADGYFRGLLVQAINSELGDGWTKIRAKLTSDKFSSTPVGEAASLSLEPFLLQRPPRFPALSLYRSSSKTEPFTLYQEKITTDWKLEYILGECSLEPLTRLRGVIEGAANVVNSVCRYGAHPDYLDGYQILVDPDYCGFHAVSIKSAEYGQQLLEKDEKRILFPMLIMTIQTEEVIDPLFSLSDRYTLQGVDLIMNLSDAEEMINNDGDVITTGGGVHLLADDVLDNVFTSDSLLPVDDEDD